jgi:hypothetical protein
MLLSCIATLSGYSFCFLGDGKIIIYFFKVKGKAFVSLSLSLCVRVCIFSSEHSNLIFFCLGWNVWNIKGCIVVSFAVVLYNPMQKKCHYLIQEI